jgi:hypothetical protein
LVAAQGVLLHFCKSLIFAHNTDHGVNLPLISANKARSWPIWGSLFSQHEHGTVFCQADHPAQLLDLHIRPPQ